MDVAIVILNYNGKKHLQQFIPSVIAFSSTFRIIIADNASTDDSVSFLTTYYPQIELLQNNENLGFAGGYNWALNQINAEYYLLLNSDVEVTQSWVEPLISILENNKNIAACQPKILSFTNKNFFEYAGAAGGFIDLLGYTFCRGRVFDTIEEDIGQYNDTKEVFWASGACIAIRSDLFHKVGGFDVDFFAHMEEVDLCWRLQTEGFKIYYTSESLVYHLGGGTLHKSNPKKTFLNYRNNLALIYKNSNSKYLLIRILARLLLDGISGIRLFFKGNIKDVIAIIKAHFAFYGNIQSLKKARKRTNKSNELIYQKSIVWEYFILKKKTFNELMEARK